MRKPRSSAHWSKRAIPSEHDSGFDDSHHDAFTDESPLADFGRCVRIDRDDDHVECVPPGADWNPMSALRNEFPIVARIGVDSHERPMDDGNDVFADLQMNQVRSFSTHRGLVE